MFSGWIWAGLLFVVCVAVWGMLFVVGLKGLWGGIVYECSRTVSRKCAWILAGGCILLLE